MRRRANGLLLPGFLLTVLASLGVGALLAAGVPVLPDGLPTLPRSDRQPERRGVTVSATESPRPRTQPPAATTPPPPASTPSSARQVSPTAGPVRTSAPVARTAGPTTAPPRTASPKPTRSTAVAAPSCKAGSAVAVAVADAYVDQSSPTQTFHGPSLLVASRDKQRNRRALVRFAVSAVPKGCSLRSATLTMTAKEPTGRRLLVARAGASWSESSVTWSKAPKPYGAPAAVTLSATTVSWNVTAHVAAGAGRGFVLYDAAENSTRNVPQANLNGRDSRTPPRLTVRWA